MCHFYRSFLIPYRMKKAKEKRQKSSSWLAAVLPQSLFFFLDVIQSFCMFFYYNNLNLLKIYIQEPI
ncbi:hypothetical protein CUS93_00580 [Enterococcus faecium]|nr:hypothetical protein CUS93_00580 [Enterococcus faecium]